MDLYDYYHKLKKETGLTLKKFSVELGISYAYLYRLMKGNCRPSFSLCEIIEDKTNGDVTLLELLKTANEKMKKNKTTKKTTH